MESVYDALGLAPADAPAQCAHVSKHGMRCARTPAEGDTVCILHGASIPQATEAVQRRLLALQEKSLAAAEELLLSYDDKVRATMVVAIWDRTGLGPKRTVAVEDARDATLGLSDEELASQQEEKARRLRAIAQMKTSSDEHATRH